MSDHRRHPAPSSWLLVLRLGIASVGGGRWRNRRQPNRHHQDAAKHTPACMGERGGMRLRA
jgi:hypothetical protein